MFSSNSNDVVTKVCSREVTTHYNKHLDFTVSPRILHSELYLHFESNERLSLQLVIADMILFKKWDGGMDRINLAQDRDRWQALVNVVMNLWVP
jgi:hypothetical protein